MGDLVRFDFISSLPDKEDAREQAIGVAMMNYPLGFIKEVNFLEGKYKKWLWRVWIQL